MCAMVIVFVIGNADNEGYGASESCMVVEWCCADGKGACCFSLFLDGYCLYVERCLFYMVIVCPLVGYSCCSWVRVFVDNNMLAVNPSVVSEGDVVGYPSLVRVVYFCPSVAAVGFVGFY